MVSQWNPGLGVLKFISEYKVYDDGYLMATVAGIYYYILICWYILVYTMGKLPGSFKAELVWES